MLRKEVWHVIGAADKYLLKLDKLRPWFNKWYARNRKNLELDDDSAQEFAYPCSFLIAQKALLKPLSGQTKSSYGLTRGLAKDTGSGAGLVYGIHIGSYWQGCYYLR